MNEILINLLQQNRAEKVRGGGRGKKIPSGTVVNEEILQEQEQPCISLQCNNLAKWLNGDSSDEEEEDDGTNRNVKTVQCDVCDEYILSKFYDKRDISADDDFLQFFHRIINLTVKAFSKVHKENITKAGDLRGVFRTLSHI